MKKRIIIYSLLILSVTLFAYAAARFNFIKTSFNAGEFSPSIYGRTDLEKYNNGCITLKNFIPIPQGGITRRPGFEYIADAKNDGDKVRLIPFQFSDDQAYILEVGTDYIRYFMDGGQILTPDASTALLLHCNGADASTTFTDDGNTGHTVTANGDAQVDTAYKKFGTGSALFDGTGDYLSAPDHADFNYGTGAVTIDIWVRFDSDTGQHALYSQSTGTDYVELWQDQDTDLLWFAVMSSGTRLILESASWNPTINTWYHVLLVRGWGGVANNWAIVVNGTAIGTFTDSGTLPDLAAALWVGSSSLLTEVDHGTTGHAITFTDTNTLSDTQSKWGGGSAHIFGNTGVSIPGHADFDISSTWTAEFWVKHDAAGAVSGYIEQYEDGSNFWELQKTAGNAIQFRIVSGAATIVTLSGGTLSDTASFHHIALIKVNNDYAIYLDGTRVASVNDSSTDTFAGTFRAGWASLTSSTLNGYMNDLRIDQGNPYGADPTSADSITIPTSHVSATANTKLLCLFSTKHLSGNIDEFRISKGVARWTANFTPPTLQHPINTSNGGAIYEDTSTGYLESELDYLKYAQSYDTMYIVHTDQSPAKLTRADHDDWTLARVDFTPAGGTTDWNATNGWPGAVTFHQDRLVFAGSPAYPPRFWFSQLSNYDDLTTGVDDDDGFTITILSGSVDTIYWLESHRRLVAGSNSGEWWLSGDGTDLLITPTSKQAQNDTKHGSVSVQPLNIGNTILFAQAPGTKIREMSYNFESDGYNSNDITILADHIFKGYYVKQMAYQQEPYQTAWVLRSDGTLFALTYMKEHEVVGWSEIETDGTIISIATIPGDPEDELWIAVERDINGTTKTYIERMKNFAFATLPNAFMVDSGLTYDGADTMTISGLDHLEGEIVDILADGLVEDATVSSGVVTLDTSAGLVHIGMPYNSDMQTMYVDVPLETGSSMFKKKRIPTVNFRLRNSAGGKYGKDSDNLVTLQSATSLYTGDRFNKSVNMGWTHNASIFVRQDDPLPLTIDSMVMEVEIGG